MLVARTEGLLIDPTAVTVAIDKLVAFANAGADCLYEPGGREKSHIEALVRAVAPKPLNVLAMGPGLTVAELADLGVRRISVGGALARVGWESIKAAAEQIKAGSFEALTSGITGAQLNKAFANRFRVGSSRFDDSLGIGQTEVQPARPMPMKILVRRSVYG